MLTVNEIFYSIQGEGSYNGYPCIFIRLTGCNLHCSYCDTHYAREGGDELAISEILKRIKGYPCRLVEVTGGEPMIQPQTPTLLKALNDAGYKLLLETNGSISLESVPNQVIKVVDLKCPWSGMNGHINWDVLGQMSAHDVIKFVVCNWGDFEWACNVMKKHRLNRRFQVYFSPADGYLEPKQLAQWLLEHGEDVPMQLQIHKIIWGSQRGR